jgi:hypothetical protein
VENTLAYYNTATISVEKMFNGTVAGTI